MNKKQQASELTRKRIAQSARNLFIHKGYTATSIEDIVAATGSSKGNIYYHFKSKEGLFLFLLEEWDRDWEEQWSEKEHLYHTVTEKLYGLVEHLVVNDFNHPLSKATNEFFGNEKDKSTVQDQITQIMDNRISFNKIVLQQGIDQGEFEEDDAKIIAIILDGLFIGLGETTRRYDIDEALVLYKKSIDVFLHGIAKKSKTKL
ncbi:TetR family transcriptional regulator [Paenibacillus baekrokdamisoli]|uniref:TetR family transcriptional regulator n=1 Tax=Paenibacillus baekrokdamisoli TaxID=1712516 RepID=A0A3G9IX20_9BACL|nr:TetR/AcrR family transcriptional regulator [Paenibacillus baekrokdamisoli]MBB3069953.1 AcrR family transcriptional regulator [Paenibacillus baekrokdamisoli]BBH20695.1 TetR family transcriptional regulator [Paenibacillus baekrokdamisoli]